MAQDIDINYYKYDEDSEEYEVLMFDLVLRRYGRKLKQSFFPNQL